jgi:hypothetical protein
MADTWQLESQCYMLEVSTFLHHSCLSYLIITLIRSDYSGTSTCLMPFNACRLSKCTELGQSANFGKKKVN